MKFIQLLSILGISVGVMTVFTYIVSALWDKRFGQPELLTQLVNSSKLMKGSKPQGKWIGWVLHYAFGGVFLFGYVYLRALFELPVTFLWGLGYGCFAGILGILGWMSLFKFHHDPPFVDRNAFYTQLFLAHIIFSLTLSLLYLLLSPFS